MIRYGDNSPVPDPQSMTDNDSNKPPGSPPGDDIVWPTLESFGKLAPQSLPPTAERRKNPRRDIEDQGVQVVASNSNLSVVDISTDGIAVRLEDPAQLLAFAVGAIVQGNIKLAGKVFPFRAV